jgi:hypothetical protein
MSELDDQIESQIFRDISQLPFKERCLFLAYVLKIAEPEITETLKITQKDYRNWIFEHRSEVKFWRAFINTEN